ncbi:uncharacterized protein DUF3793 [Orenia metallireducens]|uniref:DUF3793 domain-containing protein n=1 Tax=Orenia metallireducens TaxID=1413210 RepID=A0A285HUS0_9FIRM|nr:DUF3793 family protein [Orenia metallireducens]PRX30997.1 uncharacterized protein DUF3793 [Orenia metallireducens]SNY39460.1 Protein of unknown function [Orenia metallireducens]
MLSNHNICNKEYLKSLLSNIGATIMGVKPAELRSVILSRCGDCLYWQDCKKSLLEHQDLGVLEIGEVEKQNKIKVLFYHRFSLDRYLKAKHNLKFLREIGYPKNYSLDSYLKHLKRRLESNEFPHEIGVFFGYPLKDVLGFMGYLNLDTSDCGEWRFYGNKRVSQLQQKRFEEARNYVKERLDDIEDSKEFYEVI